MSVSDSSACLAYPLFPKAFIPSAIFLKTFVCLGHEMSDLIQQKSSFHKIISQLQTSLPVVAKWMYIQYNTL